ncbi:hypothetical protein OFS38_12750 [Escherichia coli]|nr:hypothetical protein [Escherichia coli]
MKYLAFLIKGKTTHFEVMLPTY